MFGKESAMPHIFLTEGATQIDTSIVNELIELVKSVMGLFSEFPLNVMLVAGLCFVAFRLFGAARHAV